MFTTQLAQQLDDLFAVSLGPPGMLIHMDTIWDDVPSFGFLPMGIEEALVHIQYKLCSSLEICEAQPRLVL